MAGILNSVLNAAAHPKERAEVTATTFDCLNRKTALILFAVAESVFGRGVPPQSASVHRNSR
jgi:hypothetical protein